MQNELSSKNQERGLKLALIAFLCTAGGAGLSLFWAWGGWFVMAVSMLGVLVGIGMHFWLNRRQIFHID